VARVYTPTIVLKFASGNGDDERDTTPYEGKFWVYERILRTPYYDYGIYEIHSARLEVYHLVNGSYEPLAANDRGHYPIAPLHVELGLLQGTYQNQEMLWLRWWDLDGNLLLIGNERAVIEQERAEQAEHHVLLEQQRAEQAEQQALLERQRAEQAEQRAAQLAERLRTMGIDSDAL